MSEPKSGVPRGVRLLALILGLGGLVGLGVGMGLQISALREADFRPSLVVALLGVPGTLFALSLWAGYGLWEGKPSAVTLAKILFAVQIPTVAFPGFAYHFFTGGIISLTVTHETEMRLEYQAQLGSNMGFTFSAEQHMFAIGINFVALFAFVYLMNSASRNRSSSLKVLGNTAGLLVVAIALCCSSFAQSSQSGSAAPADSSAQLRVCCRPLPLWSGSQALALKSLNGLIVRRLHHCFLDFGAGAAVSDTGIPVHTSGIHPLEPDNRNKQPMLDQATDNIDSGGVCQVVKDATPEHIRQIEDELSLGTCYSCGSNYHNRVGTARYNNSNSYAYDMVRDAGLKPPPMHGAPGYHTHWPDVKLDPEPVREENDFIGLKALSALAKTARAELLAYDNNGNRLRLYRNGEMVPLKLDTLLWTPRSCCAHRATPALSYRGSQLAYVHLRSTRPRVEAIGIFDVETHTQRDIFEATAIWGISWSRDDSRLAVIADSGPGSGPNVYLIELDSSAATRVTPGTLQVGGVVYTTSDYSPPAWNNSGTELAIEVRRRGAGAGNSDAGAIIVWDLETGSFRKVSEGVAPSWSAVSDRIAFYDRARQECYTIKPNGEDKRLLFSLREHTFGSGRAPLLYPLVWLADGSSVIFHQWVDADLISDVYRLDLHTGKAKKLARSELQLVDLRQKSQ